MAVTVLSNRKNTSVVLHLNTGATIKVAGAVGVSDLAKDDEVITGVSIVQAICGSASGDGAYWKITRGGNVVAILDSTAQIDFAGTGMALTQDPTADIVVTLEGGTDGFLVLELQKLGMKYSYLQEAGVQ